MRLTMADATPIVHLACKHGHHWVSPADLEILERGFEQRSIAQGGAYDCPQCGRIWMSLWPRLSKWEFNTWGWRWKI